MGGVITAHEATIKTAAVEVKTLTISGKQVTLAVFRQLVEEAVTDGASGDLRGEPWGTVNYHPDGCAKNGDHLHVVWQKGQELRRAYVVDDPYATVGHDRRQSALSHAVAEWLAALAVEGRQPVNVGVRQEDIGWWARATFGGVTVSPSVSAALGEYLAWTAKAPSGYALGMHVAEKKLDADATDELRAATAALEACDAAHRGLQDEHYARHGYTMTLGADPDVERARGISQRRISAAVDALHEARRRHEAAWVANRLPKALRERQRIVAEERGDDRPADVCWDAVTAARDDLLNFIARWHRQYAELAMLDQLFIAV